MASPRPVLRTVTRRQGANRALLDGDVTPATASLELVEVPVLVDGFRRMVRSLEFDVCEMAMTTYLCAKEAGVAFTALPVFLVRGFHHGAIVTHPAAGISGPKDLEGRRVGVNRGYTVTTGVWARAVLDVEHHVDLDRITWVVSGDEHVASYRPPSNVEPLAAGTTLADALATGELAAVVGAAIDRPGVVPLIGSPEEAAVTALRQRGFYPINHLVVVRDDLLREHPDLGVDLFDAFARAKQPYLSWLRRDDVDEHERTVTDITLRTVAAVTGGDPLPYGVEPNRAMIEELVTHALRQHILRERPVIETLFASGTAELVG
jgi:4,5-dihydroxyphthalate decarboxylase